MIIRDNVILSWRKIVDGGVWVHAKKAFRPCAHCVAANITCNNNSNNIMNYNIMERTACGIPGLASIVNNFCAAVRVCVRASENRLTRRIKIFWSRGRTENYKNNLTRSRKPARASEIAEIILLLFFFFFVRTWRVLAVYRTALVRKIKTKREL